MKQINKYIAKKNSQYTYKNMIISFDFDGTLCWVNRKEVSLIRRNLKIYNILKKYYKENHKIIIVTFRNPKNENKNMKIKENRVLIKDFLKKYDIKVKKIIFTNHNPKKNFLIKEKVDIHYDDCVETIKSLENTNIKGILVKKKIK